MPEPHEATRESLKLAVIPGDGIGAEVTAEALKVLEQTVSSHGSTGVKFEPTRYDLGAERYLATGEVLPDSVLGEIRQHDVILLGAVGGKPNDPNLPPGILERGLLLRLRFELDHYVNLRPSRIFPGAVSPLAPHILDGRGEVDFVVVREGTEGPYTGNGGALRVGTPHEIATEVSVNTAFGVERVGLAASGNVNPDRTTPSMFEPVHGSAPDIAGLQKADPTAAILSVSLMLDHLGLEDAARTVEDAVVADLAARTPGTSRPTAAVGDAIAARVAG